MHNLKLIKGGVEDKTKKIYKDKKFVTAFVTDTRLMGVLVMGIHWTLANSKDKSNFYQFFYYDAEEFGLDTYESIMNGDLLALDNIEQDLLGGLGGKKNSISEKEASFLLQSFVESSNKLGVSLPEPLEEYEDMLASPVNLSSNEKRELIDKICTPILSDYQLIHYFLMRSFAKDKEAASYLYDGNIDDIADKDPATLCKNTIEVHINMDGSFTYLCEAVTDKKGSYRMSIIEISISNKKISTASRKSSFRISSAEAAMMLNRPEFISVYEILSDPETFDEHFIPIMTSTLQTSHENGRLFMEFNKDNKHVNKKIFRLNDDVFGLYYVSDFGQLIIASYGLKEVLNMELALQKSSLNTFLIPTTKYEFKEPIIYDFILSNFEDFEDYILSLQ